MSCQVLGEFRAFSELLFNSIEVPLAGGHRRPFGAGRCDAGIGCPVRFLASFERSRSLFLIQSLRALGFLFFGVSAWLLEINTEIPLLKTLPDRETPRGFCFGLFSPATLNKCRAPTVPNPSRRETPRDFCRISVQDRIFGPL